MDQSKINQDSVILQQLDGQWQKMCMLILWKTSGRQVVRVTAEDMAKCAKEFAPGSPVIFTHGMSDAIEFSIVDEKRAAALAEYDATTNRGARMSDTLIIILGIVVLVLAVFGSAVAAAAMDRSNRERDEHEDGLTL